MSYWYMSAVPFTSAVPLILALTRFQRLPSYAKTICWLLAFGLVTHLVTTLMAELGVNNMPVFHLYTVGELLLIVLFFRQLMADSTVIGNYILAVGAAFLLFAVVNAVSFQHLFRFNTYARSIEALLAIGLCLVWFARQFGTDRLSFSDPALWFVVALFLYFASSFVIFIVSNLDLALDKYFDWMIWNLHATFLLILHLFYTIGFLRCR